VAAAAPGALAMAAGAPAAGALTASKLETCGLDLQKNYLIAQTTATVQVGKDSREKIGKGSNGAAFKGVIAGFNNNQEVVYKMPNYITFGSVLSLQRELLIGMAACSDLAPCAPGTPIVKTLGGGIIGENNNEILIDKNRGTTQMEAGDVMAVFLQPLSASPSAVALSIADINPTLISNKRLLDKLRAVWKDDFASVVSRHLTERAAAATTSETKAAYTNQRDLDAVIVATQQLLLGLAHLDARGIVHRDVKPENAMLHDGVWTLIDFGSSCVRKSVWTKSEIASLPIGVGKFLPNMKCLKKHTIKDRINKYKAKPNDKEQVERTLMCNSFSREQSAGPGGPCRLRW
jgi:hypothetical protein